VFLFLKDQSAAFQPSCPTSEKKAGKFPVNGNISNKSNSLSVRKILFKKREKGRWLYQMLRRQPVIEDMLHASRQRDAFAPQAGQIGF
jgi:hypothetical protein